MTTIEEYTEVPTRQRVVIAGDPVETSDNVPGAYTSPRDLPSYIPPAWETAWALGDRSHEELHLSERTNPFDPVFQSEEHAAWLKGWHGVPLQRGV